MSRKKTYRIQGILVMALVCGFTWLFPKQSVRGAVADDFIEGTVTSSKGPEAGVWVIAETKDLPTKYAKIVVTDDKGNFVIPQLPSATYQVWVRGYGLVDSSHVTAKPGQTMNLKAELAPDGRAAAQYYPANYWYSLMKIQPGEVPSDVLIATTKECATCHQVGDKATREIPTETKALGPFKDTLAAWDRRVKSGPVGGWMSGVFMGMGQQRAMYADWTDRIAAGEYPKEAPPRPTGIERNIVVSLWDWGGPTDFMHDSASADTRDPHVNSNGPTYGAVSSGDTIEWLDPVANKVGAIPIPSSAPKGTMAGGGRGMIAASPFWGDASIWESTASPRSMGIDPKGRAWFTPRIRGPQQPAFCTASSNRFANYYPMPGPTGKQVAFYDPETRKVTGIDTCFNVDHNELSPDGTTFFYGQSGTVSWVNMKIYDQTHSDEAAQGWVPAVLDTNGDGKITKPWTEPNDPIDPTKDHRINFTCYQAAVAPDGSAWCAGAGNTKVTDLNLVHIDLGSNPPETAKAEIYYPPLGQTPAIFGAGGVSVDGDGLVWVNWRGSDYITSFDRRKCKVLNGPTATGQHCPEGWTVYRQQQGPNFQGGTPIHSGMNYLIFMDRESAMGLGKNVPITGAVNSDALMALVPQTKQFVTLRVPYPMGFYARHINTRIDDPKTGWKGRGVWTSTNTYAPWHMEGGKGVLNKVVKFQIRPDPLAK
jgi:hypothetical protein